MTSFRQIEANRRNALRSTGPITEAGKRRSRRNAVRHGLTAETVVVTLEDVEDYRGFEAAVIASYDARNAVERELVLRPASLLWRLRRATAIETDLLRMQAEISLDVKIDRNWSPNTCSRELACDASSVNELGQESIDDGNATLDAWTRQIEHSQSANSSRDLASCFLRLFSVDGHAFDRLGRYESALARQVFRTLLLLKSARVR
jgi:hypothetical protein